MEHEKAGGAASDGDDKHAAVEGHEREHEEVGEPDARRVHGGQVDGGQWARAPPGEAGDAPPREQLHKEGYEKDNDQSEGVHASPRSRPQREENFRVRPPEEGHVRVPLRHLHPRHLLSICLQFGSAYR